jgi:hypothetical protein
MLGKVFGSLDHHATYHLLELGVYKENIIEQDNLISGPPDTKGIRTLGSYVGTDAYEKSCVISKVKRDIQLIEKVSQLPDAQIAYILLRCMATSRLSFIIRTSVPSNVYEACILFDTAIRAAFARIMHLDNIPDLAWEQAALSTQKYGLGFTPVTITSPYAFASAHSKCIKTHQLSPDAFPTIISPSSFKSAIDSSYALFDNLRQAGVSDAAAQYYSQKRIVAIVSHQREQAFLERKENMSDKNTARLNSISGPHANAWILAIPSCPELVIPANNFIVHIAQFLGLNFPFSIPTHCVCNHLIDTEGIHFRTCEHVGGIGPHNDLTNCLACLMRTTGHHVGTEEAMRHTHPDHSRKCPDLLMSSFFSSEQAVAVDVTIRNPVADKIWTAPLSAALAGEQDKRSKHGEACKASHLNFVPFSVEYFGALGPAACYLFLNLINEVDIDTFLPPNWAASTPRNYWMQRLSVTLINGECTRILSLRQECIHACPGARF